MSVNKYDVDGNILNAIYYQEGLVSAIYKYGTTKNEIVLERIDYNYDSSGTLLEETHYNWDNSMYKYDGSGILIQYREKKY